MAKFKKFEPQEHIRGLSEAAKQILREWKRQEEENFQECMEFFRKLAEENRLRPGTDETYVAAERGG